MKKVSKILLGLLTFALAVCLIFNVVFSAAVYSVRRTFTEEFVYNTMASVDYAYIKLPDGEGGEITLLDIADEVLSTVGITVTDKDIDSFIEIFSIDVIITSYVQQFRAWLLDYGPIPRLDPNYVAETIVSGINPDFYSLISVLADPKDMLAESFESIFDNADFESELEDVEPVREILSSGSLYLSCASAGILFLLILITRRLKFGRTVMISGLATFAGGIMLLLIRPAADIFKAALIASADITEEMLDIVYIPLMNSLHETGITVTLFGLAAAVLSAVIIAIAKMFIGSKNNAASNGEGKNGFNLEKYSETHTKSPDEENVNR